jgi:hypothetical protein
MDGARSVGGSWGLALFMRQGLAAWMHARPRHVGDDPPSSERPPPAATPSALPDSLAGQLVTILANMVLTIRQEILT